MLYLVFHVGDERYAIEARHVVELLPSIPTRPLTGAPDGVAGLIDFRGQLAPVVDLCLLILGRSARKLYSSRIIMVGVGDQRLGVLAENVTRTQRFAPTAFQAPGLGAQARFLGPVASDAEGMIQRVEPAELLTPQILAALKSAQPA